MFQLGCPHAQQNGFTSSFSSSSATAWPTCGGEGGGPAQPEPPFPPLPASLQSEQELGDAQLCIWLLLLPEQDPPSPGRATDGFVSQSRKRLSPQDRFSFYSLAKRKSAFVSSGFWALHYQNFWDQEAPGNSQRMRDPLAAECGPL